jgi:hypothetical protein
MFLCCVKYTYPLGPCRIVSVERITRGPDVTFGARWNANLMPAICAFILQLLAEVHLTPQSVDSMCTACCRVAAGQLWHARAGPVCTLPITYLREASLHRLHEADAILKRINELLTRHQYCADVVAELHSRAQHHQHTALNRRQWRS